MNANSFPKIDIWGSCVSRDTLEFVPEIVVGNYIARQSAVVSLAPSINIDVPTQHLDSDFQKRMLNGDRTGDAVPRLLNSDSQIILIDLIDERRGVWEFPSGSFLTNSVEAHHAGVEVWAPVSGARLIEFGTDEHFGLWKAGFEQTTTRLRQRGVPLILLDIDWAEVADGQTTPGGLRSVAGTLERRIVRGARQSSRSIVGGAPLDVAVRNLLNPGRTRAEEAAKLSRRENRRYRRYAKYASDRVSTTVRRLSAELRMDPDHRWGFGPYHYRSSDYVDIANELQRYLRKMTKR